MFRYLHDPIHEHLVEFILKCETELMWRLVCKKWNDIIIKFPNDKLKKISDFRSFLKFDETIYDDKFYKRIILRNHLMERYQQYNEMAIPNVREEHFDEDDIISVVNKKMSLDMKLFLYGYARCPHMMVELFAAGFISEFSKKQMYQLRNNIITNGIQPILLFLPLYYSKHYKLNNHDRQYYTILCYCNFIDIHTTSCVPDEDERYITFKFYSSFTNLSANANSSEIVNDIYDYLTNESLYFDTTNISEFVPKLQSLLGALNILVDNYHSNI